MIEHRGEIVLLLDDLSRGNPRYEPHGGANDGAYPFLKSARPTGAGSLSIFKGTLLATGT